MWAPPFVRLFARTFCKEVILNLMVWEPLQEKDFPMFARICLTLFVRLVCQVFCPDFPIVVSGKTTFHNREPLKQSNDSELEKSFHSSEYY